MRQQVERLVKEKLKYTVMWLLGAAMLVGLFVHHMLLLKTEADIALSQASNRAQVIVQDTLDGYIHGLQGIAGIVTVNNYQPSPQTMFVYAQSRQFFNNFPGVWGFGFIRYVNKKNLADYLKERRHWQKDFMIRNLDENLFAQLQDAFIIESIEPLEKNYSARGLNIGSEKNRREAALLAMKTGEPYLTDRIQLVQSQKQETGFLFYLPIYKTVVTPPTEEERIKNFVGLAYCPITAASIVESLKSKLDPSLALALYDVTTTHSTNPLFESDTWQQLAQEHSYFTERTLVAGGRKWLIKTFRPVTTQEQWSHLLEIAFMIVCLLGFSYLMYALSHSRFLQIQANHRIRDMEGWNHAVLDHANYSIISADLNGVITTFNKKAEEMLGYKAVEVVGRKTPEIIHVKDEVLAHTKKLQAEGFDIVPGFSTFIAKAIRDGVDTNEWTYVRKNGSTFPVQLSVTCIYGDTGGIVGYLGIAQDLTLQKVMENEIESQRVQMIQTSKMSSLGEMAGGVAHEINNPLAVIVMRVETIKKKLEDGSLDQAQLLDALGKIETTAEKIAQIVKGLRTFSRNAEHDPKVSCSLRSILDDTLALCKTRFHHQQIQLTVDYKLSDKDVVVCNATQISQIFMNLLNNAYDATQNLPVREVTVAVEKADPYFVISFTNNGEPIPQALAEKIMEPFFTTKPVNQGTGLGLSISHAIAKSHGGELVYDMHTERTTFRLYLPISVSSQFAEKNSA